MWPAIALIFVALALRARAIVGGTDAARNEFPSIVFIGTASIFCGGSLVGPKTVITAASCVASVSSSALRVRGGSLRHASGGVVVDVGAVNISPRYNATSGTGNIAVLQLTQALTDADLDTKKGVKQKISWSVLPLPGEDPAPGSVVVSAGWGTTSLGGSFPAALRKVTTQIISRDDCRRSYGSQIVGQDIICNGVFGGGKGSCSGDEGGPVFNADNVQVGIILRSPKGCANAGYPSISIRTAEYSLWIHKQILL